MVAFATSPIPYPEPPPRPLPKFTDQVLADYDREVQQALIAFQKKEQALGKSAAKKLATLLQKNEASLEPIDKTALRDKIFALNGIVPYKQWQAPTERDIGRVYQVELEGITQGPIWGTGPYTADSNPAVAAVHAGLVKVGERVTVEIEVLPGRDSFESSVSHGVESTAYGKWPAAYRIRKLP